MMHYIMCTAIKDYRYLQLTDLIHSIMNVVGKIPSENDPIFIVRSIIALQQRMSMPPLRVLQLATRLMCLPADDYTIRLKH